MTGPLWLEFLRFAVQEIPAVADVACRFFGCRTDLPDGLRADLEQLLGTDLRAAGQSVDARIDAERARQKREGR